MTVVSWSGRGGRIASLASSGGGTAEGWVGALAGFA